MKHTAALLCLGLGALLQGCASVEGHRAKTAPKVSPLPNIDGLESRWAYDPEFGTRVRRLEAGPKTAPVVVLLHGLNGSAEDFYALIAALSRRHRVVAIDLPGFGQSPGGNQLYTPGRFTKVLRHQLVGLGPVDLIGHSMGGAIALRYASKYPTQLKRLVLISVAGVLHGSVLASQLTASKAHDKSSALSQAVTRAFGAHIITRLKFIEPRSILRSRRHRALLLDGDPNQISAMSLALENLGPALDRVRAPSLIIWGALDHVAPMRTATLLDRRLPRSHLLVLPNADHVPMRSASRQTERAIINFLSAKTAPLAVARAPIQRQGIAVGQTNARFEGRYQTITIRRSVATLENVQAERIIIDRSVVVGQNVRVLSQEQALSIDRSKVVLTAAELQGEVALTTSLSQVDFAGVKLRGRRASILAKGPSKLLMSVTEIHSPKGRKYLHGAQRLGRGKRL